MNTRFSGLLARYVKAQRGSVAILFSISIMAVIGSVGLAFDGVRWLSVRRAHAEAIDAALLAGARYLQLNPGDTAGAVRAANAFYRSSFSKSNQLTSNSVAFTTADGDTAMTFTGTATMSTTFLNVLGIDQLDVAIPAKAILAQSNLSQGSNLEMAIMLDVTGSMCDNKTGPCSSSVKLDGVKAAASNLAEIVLAQNSSTQTMRIALVPFSSAVRIDEDGTSNPLMTTLTGMPQTWSGWQYNWTCSGSGSWVGEIWVGGSCTSTPVMVNQWKLMPCVTERMFDATGFDPSDAAPGPNNWLLGHGGDRFPLTWDSSDSSTFTQGTPSHPGYSGLSSSDPTNQWDYSADGSGCMSFPGNTIVPLTSNLTTITNWLQSLQAFGPTAGALGTVWTQYMLSPNWASVFGGSSAPGSYADLQAKLPNGAPVLRKIAVLMTDGGFNTFRQSAVDYSTDGGQQMQTVSDYALQVCDRMKANGIEIYTVGFNLDALTSQERAIATDTLKRCGTDISHFYDSISVSQLDAAFKDIAMRTTPVRLWQ